MITKTGAELLELIKEAMSRRDFLKGSLGAGAGAMLTRPDKLIANAAQGAGDAVQDAVHSSLAHKVIGDAARREFNITGPDIFDIIKMKMWPSPKHAGEPVDMSRRNFLKRVGTLTAVRPVHT